MTIDSIENLDLCNVTRAERIWLWRRSYMSESGRKTGRGGGRMSGNEAAALLGISPTVYCDVERGRRRESENTVIVAIATREAAWDTSRRPSNNELCALARRRSAAQIEELCAALGGISKPYFLELERAGDAILMSMWEARGFTF